MIFFIDAMLIAISCAADAFAVSFAYGTKKIRIPLPSGIIINGICTLVLGVSMIFGAALLHILPYGATGWAAFVLLMLSGVLKLVDSIMKKLVRHVFADDKTPCRLLARLISIYANPEEADRDNSNDISPREAAGLAAALSLDGIAIGVGASLGGASVVAVLVFAFIANVIFMMAGSLLGRFLARRVKIDISWLGGLILIALALAIVM
ncbi:MAG: manganese efflux pump [Oscillospiraceae bacterium]|nr:manganese efflux pump [Oscillospiraceae bacterium]